MGVTCTRLHRAIFSPSCIVADTFWSWVWNVPISSAGPEQHALCSFALLFREERDVITKKQEVVWQKRTEHYVSAPQTSSLFRTVYGTVDVTYFHV